MSTVFFTSGKRAVLGVRGWDSGATYSVLLAGEAYEPRPEHRTVADVTHELAGGGYERRHLYSCVIRESEDRIEFCADAVKFAHLRSTETYRWVVVFRHGDTPDRSDLICAIDMGTRGVSLRGITDHRIKWGGKTKAGRVLVLR